MNISRHLTSLFLESNATSQIFKTGARRASLTATSPSLSRMIGRVNETSPTSVIFRTETISDQQIRSFSRPRSFSTIDIKPSIEHFREFMQKPRTNEEYYNTMVQTCIEALDGQASSEFIAENGYPPDGTVEYLDKLLDKIASSEEKKDFNTSNRWANYPIKDLESLPGCSTKYSSASAEHVAKLLPLIIETCEFTSPPSIIEFGGFCHSDAFLFNQSLASKGVKISDYTGIDIFHKGVVVANMFNKEFAKIDNLSFIHNTAEGALKELSSSDSRDKNTVVIALRFLGALDPELLNPFMKNISAFLKPGDVFVFNYTLYDKAVDKIAGKPKYILTSNDKFHVLREKISNTHMQTFFSEDQIKDLLKANGFREFSSETPKVLTDKGNESNKGQFDSYTRTVVACFREEDKLKFY